MDQTFGWSYIALGKAFLGLRQHKNAITAGHQAIARQPNDADAHAMLGFFLGFGGQYDAGVSEVNSALQLNPNFFNGPYLNIRGVIQIISGDYAAGLQSFKENMERGGPVAIPVLSLSAAAYEGLGRHDEAVEMAERLRKAFPHFTMKDWNFFKVIRDEKDRERLITHMRDAGVQ